MAAMAAALTLFGTPVASAAGGPYDYAGGCDAQVTADSTAGQDMYSGMLRALAVVYSGDPARNPVSATIRCEVRVNGAPASGGVLTASGTTVLAGAAAVTYAASETQFVQVCETVDFPGFTTQSCHGVAPVQLPPQEITDAFDNAVAIVESLVVDFVDPVVCSVLPQLAGVTDPVTVEPDGDVYLLGDPIWECPPYDSQPAPLLHRWPPPFYYPAGINISDAGAGVTWQTTGLLANPNMWSCYRDTSTPRVTVICDWVGGFFPPVCRKGTATAVSLPSFTPGGSLVWGKSRTSALCIGNWVAEILQTLVADANNQFRFAQRNLVTQYAWQVQCQADNGSGGAPVRAYVADCDFLF